MKEQFNSFFTIEQYIRSNLPGCTINYKYKPDDDKEHAQGFKFLEVILPGEPAYHWETRFCIGYYSFSPDSHTGLAWGGASVGSWDYAMRELVETYQEKYAS